MRKNEEYIVHIVDNGFQGEGIAKIDGIPVFINNAIKGEKIKIKILKVRKQFAYGKIMEILEKAKSRQDIDCSTYTQCGGCNLRHINYEETLKLKKHIVENNIYKIGLGNIKINDCIGMENPYNYRNKLQYPLGMLNNNPVLGIFAERTHRIIETSNCFLQNKLSQQIANSVFDFIKENKIPIYNEQTLKGEIRHIYIRIGVKTNEVMLVLVTNKLKISKEKELIEYIIKKYPQIKTIVKNINKKNSNVILGEQNIPIYGNGYIKDFLLGFEFKISPMSFYQVNPTQTEVLYSKAIEYANLTNNETIFDLYCGIGTIGICASKNAKRVYGIETIPEAIEDAKENAKINNIKNIEFMVGNVEEELPNFIKEQQIDSNIVIFIDPPRKGCDKIAIDTILEIEPKRIVYISCNSATLARDLALLNVKYEIKEITPIDMFPFTKHVECCALLYAKKKDKNLQP